MTTEQILALPAGPELDQAVHTAVFGGRGRLVPYSTKDAAGLKLLDRLPLFVARIPENHPQFDPLRPFVAGTLTHHFDLKADVTTLRVTAATRLIAICKAALIIGGQPSRLERPSPSPQEQARDIAARIGTPAARGRILRTEQPTARVHGGDKRPPIPRRPEKFIPPTPIASPGQPIPQS